MQLRINTQARIENPRNYDVHVVDQLQALLTSGSEADPEARRRNFYEMEDGDRRYYVHVSPINGNVVLLAVWSGKSHDDCCMAENHQVA